MILIGIESVKTKTSSFYVLHCVDYFDSFALKNGSSGQMVFKEIFFGELPSVDVGDEIEFIYKKGYNGKAILSGFRKC